MTRHFLGRSPDVRDVAYVLCNSIPRALREAKNASGCGATAKRSAPPA
jgi:hypothetical protein